MTQWSSVRRAVSWILLAGGMVVVVAGLVSGFTSDPRTGEGWAGGVASAVLAGGPLLAIGAALRSSSPRVVRWTAAAAACAAAAVLFVLVMQLLDENETTANQSVTAVVLLAYLTAVGVELAAMRSPRVR